MAHHQASDTDQDGPVNDPGDSPRRITKDNAFHILQNARRRAVLRYLLAHDDDEFQMRDTAEDIAAWEHETTVQELSSDERQRVYIALYQSHLPKLDDHGVIEYDQGRGVIRPTPLIQVFAPLLDEGLDTDTDKLTVNSQATPAGESPSNHRLARALSTLLNE